MASTSGLLRKVGVSDRAALPPAFGGAEGFGLLITIRVLVLVCAAFAVFAGERQCDSPSPEKCHQGLGVLGGSGVDAGTSFVGGGGAAESF